MSSETEVNQERSAPQPESSECAVSRRLALKVLGALALSSPLLACGDPATEADDPSSMGPDAGRRASDVDSSMLDCVATPQMTEGPFFSDESLNRSDLLTGEESNVASGLPLSLTMEVFKVAAGSCTAFAGAKVDIWHADIDGLYSNVAANFLQQQDTTGKTFCRAYQIADEGGVVTFDTIFPGWYGTRAVHIHFKIRVEHEGSAYELTSQLYFDEEINDAVMAEAPYSARGERTVRNQTDQVYNGTGLGVGPDTTPPLDGMAPGAQTTVKLSRMETGRGYSGVLRVGVMMG